MYIVLLQNKNKIKKLIVLLSILILFVFSYCNKKSKSMRKLIYINKIKLHK